MPLLSLMSLFEKQSSGELHGFCENQSIRKAVVSLDFMMMAQPDGCISSINEKFIGNSDIIDQEIAKFLQDFLVNLQSWISKF